MIAGRNFESRKIMWPIRSALFVPAHRRDWVAKALRVKPGAVVLDIEDSVPVATMPTLSLTTACSAVAGQFLVWGTSTAATPPQFNMVFDLAGWFRP